MPDTYAYFFIPNYPSDIATVNFDISGATKIGKYYLNHSFMLPRLIGLTSACLLGVTLAELIIKGIAHLRLFKVSRQMSTNFYLGSVFSISFLP